MRFFHDCNWSANLIQRNHTRGVFNENAVSIVLKGL